MLERYWVWERDLWGHNPKRPDSTKKEKTIEMVKAADAHATIADLQGQLKAAKAPRMYDCGSCAIGKGFEQRVAQLEGEKGTLRLGLNALRDSYDELEGRHSDIQADHARVLGLVQALPSCEGQEFFISLIDHHSSPACWQIRVRNQFGSDLFLAESYNQRLMEAILALLAYRQSLPAQPAQGGGSKEATT